MFWLENGTARSYDLLTLDALMRKPILKPQRQTGSIGFLLCADAVQGLENDLVCWEHPILKYVLMYNMNQDHLELFFDF